MNDFEKEMGNPKDNLPKQKFHNKTKFSFIMCNEVYDPDYVTHTNLPEVVNDLRNAKQTAKMMGIPLENTVILQDASHE